MRYLMFLIATIWISGCAHFQGNIKPFTFDKTRAVMRQRLIEIKNTETALTKDIGQLISWLNQLDQAAWQLELKHTSPYSTTARHFVRKYRSFKKRYDLLIKELDKPLIAESYQPFKKLKCILIGVNEYQFGEPCEDAYAFINDLNLIEKTIDGGYLLSGIAIDKTVLNTTTTCSKSVITNLLSSLTVDDDTFLFIYYTAHGSKLSDDTYVMTSDRRATTIKNTTIAIGDLKKWFKQALKPAYNSTGLLVIASCHTHANVEQSLEDDKGVIMTSNHNHDNTSLISTLYGHGIFTYYFCQSLQNPSAIEDIDNNGLITINELYLDVWIKVKNYMDSRIKKDGKQQVPGIHYGNFFDNRLVLDRVPP